MCFSWGIFYISIPELLFEQITLGRIAEAVIASLKTYVSRNPIRKFRDEIFSIFQLSSINRK